MASRSWRVRCGATLVGATTISDVIVYVLTHNEANEGGTVEGVNSSKQKAREGAADARLPGGEETISFWEILPVGVDGRVGDLDSIRID
jgi:hypothetical protein